LEETEDVRLVVDNKDRAARVGQTVGFRTVQLKNPASNLAWKPSYGKRLIVIDNTNHVVSIRSCKGV
jgi:hypothetical protein